MKTIRSELRLWWFIAICCQIAAWSLWFGFGGCSAMAEDPARQTTEYRKALAEYRVGHLTCEWCLQKEKLEIHHIQPVHVFPELAADTNNLVALCDACHLVVGHARNNQLWVSNLKDLIKMRKIEGRKP